MMRKLLPDPPEGLSFEDISLFFVGVMPGDDDLGTPPHYHHRITAGGADVGHINFSVGGADLIEMYTGHVGYAVKSMYWGNGYAGKACRALAPLLTRHQEEVILTSDPSNLASVRTIEKLGARYDGEHEVPESHPLYRRGLRRKLRYVWDLRDRIQNASPQDKLERTQAST